MYFEKQSSLQKLIIKKHGNKRFFSGQTKVN